MSRVFQAKGIASAKHLRLESGIFRNCQDSVFRVGYTWEKTVKDEVEEPEKVMPRRAL